jgi:predicted membrane protein
MKMVSVGAIVEGFILAIIITVVLSILGVGSVVGLPVAIFGFLIAGIIVGYISYGDIIDGVINGALMGVAGAVILWILSLFTGEIAAFSSQLSTFVPLNSAPELILVIVAGAIGGLIGSLILLLNRRNRRNYGGRREGDSRNDRDSRNDDRRDDRDQRDDRDRRD